MTTTPALPVAQPRRTASTVALVGFLVLIPMAYGGFVLLPLANGIPFGILAWFVIGGLAALWRGSLAASIGGALAGMAFALVAYGGLSRLFGNTPWYLTPDRFAMEFGLSVACAMAVVAAGHILVSLVRGRSPFASATPRGLARLLGIAVLVVAGGTLLAERMQAVVPFGASQPFLVVAEDRFEFSPGTSTAGPMYWTFENVNLPGSVEQPRYEVGILRIASDAELALRLTGEMGGTYESDSRVLGWIGLPTAGTSNIRRGDLAPGRYLILVVEALPPQVEGQPDQGGESADRVVVEGLYAEFTVTD